MFRFEHIEYFGLFLVIPILVGIFFFFIKKQNKEWAQLGNEDRLVHFLHGQRKNLSSLILTFALIASALVIFALANPQFSNKKEDVDIESTDIFIAVDISRSMMAEDLKLNRLERAKFLSKEILKQLEGNRVGLILFAGEAYMHMPLTTDLSSAYSFLESANPEMAPTQGTAIAASLNLAVKSFDEENDKGRAVIILSDGEDHEADMDEAIDLANENNILVFTIAVGTEEGAYLPGINQDNYLFDTNGKPVKSVVNADMLKDIARQTGGNFFNLYKEHNIEVAIKKNIDQMEKQITAQASFKSYESYYQYLLLPVILLLGFELFRQIVGNRQTKNDE